MKFSIIIPAHNEEKTLLQCLNSVRQQTYQNFEAIIIDDGSQDKTPQIAQAYVFQDPRFRYIRQSNQGVSAARNAGLDAASGDFIVFLDSDDRYKPDYLQHFNDLTNAFPDCDHFWCGFQTVDAVTGRLGHLHRFDDAEEYTRENRSHIMNLHEKWMDSTLWNKAYRRSILEQHAIRMDPSLSLGEDLLFNYQYLDHGRTEIIIDNAALYEYSYAGNGRLDSKYRQDLKEIYDYLDAQVLTYLQKWNVSAKQLAKYYTSVFYMQEKILRNTFRPENQLSRAKKYRYNRDLLRSPKFKTALRLSDCRIHPLYRFGYIAENWRLIQLLDSLSTLKKNICGLKV